MNIVHFI